MFEFQGEPMMLRHKAMSAVSVKVYQYLTGILTNSGTYNILACIILKAFDYFILYLGTLNQRRF